jgi:hypothetical protein
VRERYADFGPTSRLRGQALVPEKLTER